MPSPTPLRSARSFGYAYRRARFFAIPSGTIGFLRCTPHNRCRQAWTVSPPSVKGDRNGREAFGCARDRTSELQTGLPRLWGQYALGAIPSGAEALEPSASSAASPFTVLAWTIDHRVARRRELPSLKRVLLFQLSATPAAAPFKSLLPHQALCARPFALDPTTVPARHQTRRDLDRPEPCRYSPPWDRQSTSVLASASLPVHTLDEFHHIVRGLPSTLLLGNHSDGSRTAPAAPRFQESICLRSTSLRSGDYRRLRISPDQRRQTSRRSAKIHRHRCVQPDPSSPMSPCHEKSPGRRL